MAQPNMYNQDQKWLTGLAGKRWFYRLWEIIPGVTSWIVLISPIFFSLVWPIAVAYFIIAFDLLWLLKSVRMSAGLIEGYMALKKAEKIDWQGRLNEIEDIDASLEKYQAKLAKQSKPGLFGLIKETPNKNEYNVTKANYERLRQIYEHKSTLLKPSDIHHVIITAVYNESIDVLKPSLEAILKSEYDPKKIIFVLAYEQRGGEQTAENAKILEKSIS